MAGFIVMLEDGVWLADGEGDPSRTLQRANAWRFEDEFAAGLALDDAREFRPFRGAYIFPVCDSTQSVLEEVALERSRQKRKGYDAEKDDGNQDGEMEDTVAVLALGFLPDGLLPIGRARAWSAYILDKWKESRRRQLVIATALLVAAIERLDRQGVSNG